jgi:hypothetical protein
MNQVSSGKGWMDGWMDGWMAGYAVKEGEGREGKKKCWAVLASRDYPPNRVLPCFS